MKREPILSSVRPHLLTRIRGRRKKRKKESKKARKKVGSRTKRLNHKQRGIKRHYRLEPVGVWYFVCVLNIKTRVNAKLFETNSWIETDSFSACFPIDFVTKFDNFFGHFHFMFIFFLTRTKKIANTSENVLWMFRQRIANRW